MVVGATSGFDLGAMETGWQPPTIPAVPDVGDGKLFAGLHAALDQLETHDANLPAPLHGRRR